MMSMDDGIFQARKVDLSLSIVKKEQTIRIMTAKTDMPFVKTAVYELMTELHESFKKLKESTDPQISKRDLLDKEEPSYGDLLSKIFPDCVSMALQGKTKEEIITELVDILAKKGRLLNRNKALKDILEREKSMSTGMQHGIALPHAKTDAVHSLVVAVGIKKEGVDFESLDGEKSRLFVLVVSPRKTDGSHVKFLTAIGTILKDAKRREEIINAASPEEVVRLLRG
jgi:fructose-specific phosphotransferase system IIA component